MGTNPTPLSRKHQIVDYTGLALRVSEIQNLQGQVLVDGEVARPATEPDLVVTDTSLSVTDTSLSVTDIAAAAGLIKVYRESVDCSAGGTAVEEALVTVPLGAILLSVGVHITTAFNGAVTTTVEIGETGNTDRFIDPLDIDPSVLNDAITMSESVNADDGPQFMVGNPGGIPIVATWTNTTGASAGAFDVTIVWIDPADADLGTDLATAFAEVETAINTNIAASFAEVETAINTNIAASFAEVETKINNILSKLETAGILADA